MGTKNEIVYDLRHFERDFNGTEQVNGLELALAEPKKDIRIKMLANDGEGGWDSLCVRG
ncbi:MAG: hypothetical protein ACLR78_06320 [Roseburia sp.]